MKIRSIILLPIILLLSVVIILIIYKGNITLNREPLEPTELLRNQITDLNRYLEIKCEIEEKYIKHFPEVIPDIAEDVSLIYVPRIFQGAEIFQIKMKLPEENIIELSSYYEENAIVITNGDEFTDYGELMNVQKPIYLLSGGDSHKFTEDYRIYYLGIEAAGSQEFIWNHGDIFGISINKSKHIVVYWFEYW